MMTEYKIEKNVPRPVNPHIKYPFEGMDIGDSFLYTGDRSKINSAAHNHGKRSDTKFSIRKEGKGFRVWRTE